MLDDPTALEALVPLADDAAFRERFAAVRRANKVALAALVRRARSRVSIDPDALFDVQVKRIHEYKRQLLNILETIALYNAMRAEPGRDWVPRVKIFAGKAAASYHQAKLIIKLANDVARIVNRDPTVRGLLKVVFLPNYNVSLAEAIIPAADLSEQISTAGMEASGTGNMKLALNGALTIGTLDGANIEIREHVGAENIFIFGLTAAEVEDAPPRRHRRQRGDRGVPRARARCSTPSPRASSRRTTARRYRGLVDAPPPSRLLHGRRRFRRLPRRAGARSATLWHDPGRWWRTAILNTAHVGWFSSDRAIREYAREIWRAEPVRP